MSQKLIRSQSTLSQIQTKGINRGGLYGFFVKGEEIAGTIDDSTDASIPASGASTPPTSASESESLEKPAKMSEPTNKRKHEDDAAPSTNKKAKKERRVKGTPRDPTKSKHGQLVASPEEQEAVDRKIAKMSPRKKEWYEERAAAKGQTVEQLLLRRIQKSNKKLAKRNKLKAAKEARLAPTTPMFVTDLEGDATLAQQAAATEPGQPVMPVDAAASEAQAKKAERRKQRKEKRVAKKAALKANPKKKVVEYSGRNDFRKAMKEKKERKKAEKAEKHKGGRKTTSKWGNNKDQSRWGKLKAAKKAAKEAAEAAKSA